MTQTHQSDHTIHVIILPHLFVFPSSFYSPSGELIESLLVSSTVVSHGQRLGSGSDKGGSCEAQTSDIVEGGASGDGSESVGKDHCDVGWW